MKTLDEVIKAYELCLDKQIKCSYCPYHADGCPESRKLDALHYLKEYRDVLNTHIYIPDGYTQPKIGDKNR